jgi:hypothetical protein
MRNLKLIILFTISVLFASCEDNEGITTLPVESKSITNLAALQSTDYTQNPPVTSGSFTKFSFKEGSQVSGDNWDIAFRGTTILVNGGAEIGGITEEPQRTGTAALALLTGTLSSITEAPADSEFKQDASGEYALTTGSGNGWYTYAGPPTHMINPIAGKVLVIRTIDGNYAKVEIVSYYKDNDASKEENARHYSFNYIYNPNKGEKDFQ